ncbi:hypothetical protein [Paenibacillus bouchesdurhonensis]|uniref:hypothetical protein n=1 Tax=Paenibacillus bouchesdurhonensis TaxID=1870990 RepID=UPI000DA5EF33|nr:hypothetical protein [Paenibacillus bouchesdurhonensis]
MIKYMDKRTFKDHMLQALKEIAISRNVKLEDNCKFTVVPVIEHGKSLNSTDEYLHRGMFNEKKLSGREFDLEAVVNMLACRLPLCPLWINVALKEIREDMTVIELQISLRFRNPSLLQNQDTGHPPFKSII